MSKRNNRAVFLRRLRVSWQKAFANFISLGRFSSPNDVVIFHDGDEAVQAIYDAILNAKKSIHIETYILAADRVGLGLQQVLIAAAVRGVKVVVLYDHFGSAGLPASFVSPMIAAGISVMAFNPIWPWRQRGPLLFRNHRKIIIVDEEIGFCGSMNISADYAGPRFGNDRYRDSIARIVGPAVGDLLGITLESIAETTISHEPWHISRVKVMDFRFAIKLFLARLTSSELLPEKSESSGALVQVLPSNMRKNLAHIQKSMEEAVNRAVNYCYFTTPYFLPQQGLRRALINARRRGVDVRILTAGLSDVPLMRYAGRHVFRSLLAKDVRVYEMTKKTLHAKLATIDGIYSSIGSYNLDQWSARRNLEVNISIIDRAIAIDQKNQFERDLELSEEIDKHEFFGRSLMRQFFCWIAYVLLTI